MGLSSLKFLYWAPKDASFLQSSAYRPFKVIQGRWFWYKSKARMVLLLVRHSNHPIISDKLQLFGWKLQIFFHPTLMWRPSSDVLFGTSWGSLPRRNYGAILQWRPHDRSLSHFDTTPPCDRQTDGRTYEFTIARTASCWRCKKHYICHHRPHYYNTIYYIAKNVIVAIAHMSVNKSE